MTQPPATQPSPVRELAFALCYFAFYIAMLFARPESEARHWLSLVVLPLVGVGVFGRRRTVWGLLSSIGVRRVDWARGMGWTLILGTAFQVLQLLNVRQRGDVVAILTQPRGPLVLLGALLLLLCTAATTEEVFFRGIIQQRLTICLRNGPAALAITVLAFILYHVPYAYLNPAWPSVGNLSKAIGLAAVNGAIGGLATGFVFWRSQGNLAPAIALHTLIDLVPAVRQVGHMLN
jgi:membrane protease YdiL (CAAX protease family)